MSDSDNSGSESVEPPTKKAKSHDGTLKSHHTRQSSKWSQNIIGHHQDHLKTRHTFNDIVNNNKKERQKRYREQNREKLKRCAAERRKRIQNFKSTGGPSTSSNTNTPEVNNKEPITILQKKRECQRRYRERNRDKLKQREKERRKRLQNAEMIIELYNSPNIESTEIIIEPIIIIDEISTDSESAQSWFGRNEVCSG